MSNLEKHDLSDPKAFTLFAAFMVSRNFYTYDATGVRKKLGNKAAARFMEPEVERVMAYFAEFDETKAIYEIYKSWVKWITY